MTENSALGRLATRDRFLAMVALDQRESLRAYLSAAGAADDDAALVAFKRAALADLGSRASAFLLDLDYGVPALAAAGAGALTGGLILAADELVQNAAGEIVDTDLDPRVDARLIETTGAAALKLLLVWDDDAARRAHLRAVAERFIRRCTELGALSLVETLMTPATRATARGAGGGDLYEEMAADLGDLPMDIYKTEVPGDPEAPLAPVTARAAAITDRLACPWVLLSNGVAPDRFADVVGAVCAGGASGFLAGRAVWRPALTAEGYDATRGAADRLAALVALVARTARPLSGVRPAS